MMKPNELKTYETLNKMKITTFSPIQNAAFSSIYEGKNMIVQAPTGTGKTLAYLLPIFEKSEVDQTLQTVVVAPTRELVMQIVSVIQALGGKVTPLIGGANVKRQLDALKAKPNFVVGTPDRLVELLQNKKLKVHTVKQVVLDEFDEMYKQRQGEKLRKIISSMMRQTAVIAVSATVHKDAFDALSHLRTDFEKITVTSEEHTAGKLAYHYILVDWNKRKDALRRFATHIDGKSLAFSNDRFLLETFSETTENRNSKMATIHSQTEKVIRANRIQAFRKGKIKLLLSTDLTARGMDISDLKNVVHVDLPENDMQWKHRNGRVGRMGKAGCIYFIVPTTDEDKFHKLMHKYKINNYNRYYFPKK